ncbi:helix-turn-helix domain-containing protein [Streptomyces sp. NPDC058613]|uniref:PucR family transcriptional regulator n=1 Tax=unclassified Streptomyces TaxID=2593676 RepID=UPI003669F339
MSVLTDPAPPAALRSASVWSTVSAADTERFISLASTEIPTLSLEVMQQIHAQFPQVVEIFDDHGVSGVLTRIRLALGPFVESVRAAGGPKIAGDGAVRFREAAASLDRCETLPGPALDFMRAVYRFGARVSWRRLTEIADGVGIPPAAMYELAEAGFDYIEALVGEATRDQLSNESLAAGERLRRQCRLVGLLLADQPADLEATAQYAANIGWRLPETVAIAVLNRNENMLLPPALGTGILLDWESEQPRLVVPGSAQAGRADALRQALPGWSGALGPTVPLAQAARSLHWAQTAVGLIAAGALPSRGVLDCAEHTTALLLLPPAELIDDLAAGCLAPLAACRPGQADRLADTLLAWLQTRGGAAEVAARIGVHPQTVRYRMRQLRELWGDALDDHDQRFALELVLRARKLQSPPSPGRPSHDLVTGRQVGVG